MQQAESNDRIWGRLTDPPILFSLIAVGLLAVVWSTTFAIIRANDAATAHAAAASTRELLGTYEAQVVRALSEIDHTLNLVNFWPHRASGRTLADLKDKGLLPPDLLFVVSIADRSGAIVDSTRPTGRKDIYDQDYFRKQREGERHQTPEQREPFGRLYIMRVRRFAPHDVPVKINRGGRTEGVEFGGFGRQGGGKERRHQ